VNRKQLILLFLALAVIGSAGLILFHQKQKSWSVREAKMGDKLLPNFQLNDVSAIHIKGPGSGVNLVRKSGIWRVRERADYPANYEQIRDLLVRMRDLKIIQSEMIGPSQLARVDLELPEGSVLVSDTTNKSPTPNQVSVVRTDPSHAGTLLEFKDSRGKLFDTLLLGKRHLRPPSESDPFRLRGLFDGRYVLLPSDPQNVLLISDELASVSPEPGSWLNREFFRIGNIKTLSLISSNGANPWTLSREAESSPWTLLDSKPGDVAILDTNVVSQIAEALGFLTFIDVLTESDGASSLSSKPTIVFVEISDHFFYTLKIGSKRPDGNYHLTVAIKANISADIPHDKTQALRDKLAKEQALTQWTFVVESHLLDPLLRDRSQLLEKQVALTQQIPPGK
jgi:hypothetical protein